MEVIAQKQLPIDDESQLGGARRAAAALAQKCGLSETETGRVSLIVNELTSNLLKHAQRGEILLSQLSQQGRSGIEVLALDRGPGMNVELALRDGHSTAGTRGEGLGAVKRNCDLFDAWSAPKMGAVVVSQIWAGGKPDFALQLGAVSQPYPGETVCGDAWSFVSNRATHRLLVVDGLGHGTAAAKAAQQAVHLFEHLAPQVLTIEQVVQDLHNGLRPTRGAALMVLEIDLVTRQVRACGIGNVAGSVISGPGQSRGLISHSGIAGHEARRVQEFIVPLSARAVVVLHSDGLLSQWRLDPYPGLHLRHPSLIAGVLYRDHRRKTDDSTVVVIKEP